MTLPNNCFQISLCCLELIYAKRLSAACNFASDLQYKRLEILGQGSLVFWRTGIMRGLDFYTLDSKSEPSLEKVIVERESEEKMK